MYPNSAANFMKMLDKNADKQISIEELKPMFMDVNGNPDVKEVRNVTHAFKKIMDFEAAIRDFMKAIEAGESIDPAELKKAYPASAENFMKLFDKNKDKKLSVEECKPLFLDHKGNPDIAEVRSVTQAFLNMKGNQNFEDAFSKLCYAL